MESDLFFFSEEKYILEKPEAFDKQRIALLRETPSVENIYEFIKALYDCAQFRYDIYHHSDQILLARNVASYAWFILIDLLPSLKCHYSQLTGGL